MMHFGNWGYGWHMVWMLIGWLVVALVVALVLRAVISASRRDDSLRDSPEDALKRRYAKGEIDRDTYERMLEDLRK